MSNRLSIHSRKIPVWFATAAAISMLVGLFFMPVYVPFRHSGSTMFQVTLNGTYVGVTDSRATAEHCLTQARRTLAKNNKDLVYVKAELGVEGEEVLWGQVDQDSEITKRMVSVLDTNVQNAMTRCYTVKIGENTINMQSRSDILTLLEKALSQYDKDGKYVTDLALDTSREINVLVPKVITTQEQALQTEKEESLPSGGINATLSDVLNSAQPAVGRNFEDYKLGITAMDFTQKIEIAEAYMPSNQISDLTAAEEEVLKQNEQQQIYEVKQNDTLSGIAEMYGITLDELLTLNPNYSSSSAILRVGDEITVTSPQPELSVSYTKQEYYEEDYTADVIYKDNPDWYITKTEVVQEASKGHRRVIALNSYEDSDKVSTSIVKEEVTREAVPEIIERGTKVPPTFIWPVSGGSISSGFGHRSSPGGIGSTNHQGLDIAVSTGTAVMASSSGTVTVAGWQSGYGYVVYINHADGKQTRYGHLSRVLVHVGQSVIQGQKIALSGSTGNSTGPHLHFEMRINGTAVNPLSYLN
ncbi:MAG: peptidoglycan DD-metalloendopeptidase family protein [Lachnospiraceae bacterium]|nr:peptidoglycan DD-metalloendopeptidase family protein [Lachnospiraceae bacterium]